MLSKNFANVSLKNLAGLLGLKLVGRKSALLKSTDTNNVRYLSSAIHVYILLHFYSQTADGYIFTKMSDLMNELIWTKETIYLALTKLEAGGYITIIDYAANEYLQLQLMNLSEMYLKRGEGGHGFFTMNVDALRKILSTRNIDEIRTAIVTLISATEQKLLSAAKSNSVVLSIKSLKQAFPKSTRAGQVRNTYAQNTLTEQLFEEISCDDPRIINMRMRHEYDGKTVKQQIRVEAQTVIGREIKGINDCLEKANHEINTDHILHSHHVSAILKHGIDLFQVMDPLQRTTALPLLEITSSVKNDCVTIAQDFGVDAVLQALRTFYMEYLIPGAFKHDQKKSLGGLIRRIVVELCCEPSEFERNTNSFSRA